MNTQSWSLNCSRDSPEFISPNHSEISRILDVLMKQRRRGRNAAAAAAWMLVQCSERRCRDAALLRLSPVPQPILSSLIPQSRCLLPLRGGFGDSTRPGTHGTPWTPAPHPVARAAPMARAAPTRQLPLPPSVFNLFSKLCAQGM